MTTIEALKELRTLLEDPRRWTQRNYQNYIGNGEYAYCLIGGADQISKIHGHANLDTLITTLHKAAHKKGWKWGLAEYNDTHTHAEVISLIDEAISMQEIWL